MRSIVAAAALLSTGCGALLQTAAGWATEENRRSTRDHEVHLRSTEAMSVARVEADGSRTALGPAPVTDTVAFDVEETIEVPNGTAPMWIGAALDVAVAILGGALLASSGSDGDISGDPGTQAAGVYLLVYAGGAAIADAVFAVIMKNRESQVLRYAPIAGGKSVDYVGVTAEGAEVTATVGVPWAAEALLEAPVKKAAPEPEEPPPPVLSGDVDPFAPPTIP